AAFVRQPDYLEQVVPFDQAVRVVVDRLAGPREQAGRAVVLAQNQVRVCLAALQRDADRHLINRAARQRVGPAQRLRAEEDMQAERAALADEPVEQKRGFLGQLVVFDEELLQLVHDQQDPRQSLIRPLGTVTRDVVDAGGAVFVAANLQFRVQSLQDAQAELALALDRDDAGVRQVLLRVWLELDTLLEVDQIQFNFIRAVDQAQVGDDRVQERGLAGAGLAGDQAVLRGPAAQTGSR